MDGVPAFAGEAAPHEATEELTDPETRDLGCRHVRAYQPEPLQLPEVVGHPSVVFVENPPPATWSALSRPPAAEMRSSSSSPLWFTKRWRWRSKLRGNRLAVLNGLGHQLKQHRRKETLGLVRRAAAMIAALPESNDITPLP